VVKTERRKKIKEEGVIIAVSLVGLTVWGIVKLFIG